MTEEVESSLKVFTNLTLVFSISLKERGRIFFEIVSPLQPSLDRWSFC